MFLHLRQLRPETGPLQTFQAPLARRLACLRQAFSGADADLGRPIALIGFRERDTLAEAFQEGRNRDV
jgi:hypothetical protein